MGKTDLMQIVGQRFSRLIVVRFSHTNKNSYWVCKCDCGNESIVAGNNLKRGISTSCGCLRKETTYTRSTTHHDTRTRFYNIWCMMKRRILNPKCLDYPKYGGRGIQLCSEWMDFINFKNDMHESYLKHVAEFGEKDTTIERKNNDGNYNPSNCCWATKAEQVANYRHNRIINYNGLTLHLAEAARKYGINPMTLVDRLDHGWSVEQAIEEPVRKRL